MHLLQYRDWEVWQARGKQGPGEQAIPGLFTASLLANHFLAMPLLGLFCSFLLLLTTSTPTFFCSLNTAPLPTLLPPGGLVSTKALYIQACFSLRPLAEATLFTQLPSSVINPCIQRSGPALGLQSPASGLTTFCGISVISVASFLPRQIRKDKLETWWFLGRSLERPSE